MSSPGQETVLKAGHPPAVKAGGMRITQHNPTHEKPAAPERKDSNSEEEEQETPVSTTPPKQVMISGAPSRGDADFPPAAVQSFHSKPEPAHEYRAASSKPQIIHQPRK